MASRVTDRNLIALARMRGREGYVYFDETGAQAIPGGAGGGPADTDALPEGVTNLYHTNERVRDAIAAALVSGPNIVLTINDAGDTITIDSSGGGGDPLLSSEFIDECQWPTITSYGWSAEVGSGTVSVLQNVTDMPGCYSFLAQSVATNRAGAINSGYKVTVGAHEIRMFYRVKPQHVPGVGQQNTYMMGMCNSTTTAFTDGIYFLCSDTDPLWKLGFICAASGTNNVTTNGYTPVADTIVNLYAVIAADGLSADFYADGTFIDTLVLPAGFTAMHPFIRNRKNGAGGGASTLWLDKVLLKQNYY